ncbi:RNA polymerase sigma factor [Gemmata sp. JC717]|uniref:RNA polymerase sigma factor n=1 Tax=Gemmata algarum TaxID=2975278 RepID=UPI0021BB56B0|nr:RNA polymerase sigma factor [Gemmata algarum]MDY3557229.1 RNA polymerase sigma factor [Gemmata algarum]
MPVSLLKLCPPAEGLTPDAELLGRFAATRDEAAFTELVRRHGPIVYRACRRLVPGHADDAFQAVFLILARQFATVRKPAAVGSWLVGTAGRVARQMRKAEHRRTRCERQAGRDEVQVAPPDFGELASALEDEIARLPDELRDPVVLCWVGGRTYEQATIDLGTSARTLRRKLDRARAVLRARLARRGIVPAVAAAFVAGPSEAAVAVPAALVARTVSVMFQFLDGGAPHTAAVAVAKGVVDGMAKFKVSVAMATAAAVLVCLGVVWSQDQPVPPGTPTPAGAGHSAVLPLAGAPGAPEVEPERIPARDVNRTESKTANFVVHAPTPMMARVIAAEAEHHRRAIALAWLGQELPPWPKPCVIRFTPGGSSGGATGLKFGTNNNGEPALATAEMEVRGDFLLVLASTLPHEVTHTVFASHFGKALPRWADEGVAVMSESDDEQLNHDVRARELLGSGRGIRLKVLFRLTEYPRDMVVLFAQGHSVARFLASAPAAGTPVLKDIPNLDRLFRNPGADGRRRLVAFLQLGTDGNTAESWDKAAKAVYGYGSMDALEEAWLEWLAKPENVLTRKDTTPRPASAPKPGGELIPPVQFPVAPGRP